MSEKKQSMPVPTRGTRDPFVFLRQMTSELDRAFDDWPSFRRPSFGLFASQQGHARMMKSTAAPIKGGDDHGPRHTRM